jgi:hypothetical protein
MTKKSKVEIGALVVLVLLAGGIWYYFVHPEAGSASLRGLAVASYKPMAVENPQIHWDRLSEAQQTDYKTSGRDIFTVELTIPEPLPFRIPQTEVNDTPVPPPPPPPKLPLKFFGYGAAQAGSGRRAFLTDGNVVYIVAEGDSLLGRYRIGRISQVNLEFEELGSGRHGSTAIEDQGPAM